MSPRIDNIGQAQVIGKSKLYNDITAELGIMEYISLFHAI